MNEDYLKYTEKGSSGRYVLYQGSNDINIFVEDLGTEFEYETIFKRLLKEKYKIKAVFSCSGKQAVIKEFNKRGTGDCDTPPVQNIYLVDGDFDRYISPEKMISHPNFIYLEAYNIENYLIDEKACTDFAIEILKKTDDYYKKKSTEIFIQNFNFGYWQKTIVEDFKNLYILYCVIQRHEQEFYEKTKTTKRPCIDFIDQKTGFKSKNCGYENLLDSTKSKVTQLDIKIEEITEKYIKENGYDFYNLICGKFIFKSLRYHLESFENLKIKKDTWRKHALNNFDIHKLDYVKDAIISVMSAK